MQSKMEARISSLALECQKIREAALEQQLRNEATMRNLWSFIYSLQVHWRPRTRTLHPPPPPFNRCACNSVVLCALQTIVTTAQLKREQAEEEKERITILTRLQVNKARHELKAERTYCHNLQLVIHSQRGRMAGLRREINDIKETIEEIKRQRFAEAQKFRRELWEHIYSFTRLGTDVDFLFEFFAARLANLVWRVNSATPT